MNSAGDWEWKLTEAAERLRTRYEHIGRRSGAPFLAIVYAPEIERAFLKEWHTLAATLEPELSIRSVDVLEVTACIVRQFGAESLVDSMRDPMPGSDPTSELGSMWTSGGGESPRGCQQVGIRPARGSAGTARRPIPRVRPTRGYADALG